MQAHYSIATLLLISSLLACSSTDKKNPFLEEAGRYHTKATEIQAELEPKIDKVDSLKAVLNKHPTPTTMARIATLDSLKMAFGDWEKNLVEVPGMPHEHTHGKGEHAHHHHADATLKDLPADQMRDLQRETLNNIKQMQSRFEAVTPSH